MDYVIRFTLIMLLVGVSHPFFLKELQAADSVVVIPLYKGGGKQIKNVITVAIQDGQFADPVAAVDSIDDASEDNPYLVYIGPGVYTLTESLVMKPYVDICGSGQNITLLTGAIFTGDYSIVLAANNSTLSHLSITNTGNYDSPGNRSVGIYTNGLNRTARIQHVNVTATGSPINMGYGIVGLLPQQ